MAVLQVLQTAARLGRRYHMQAAVEPAARKALVSVSRSVERLAVVAGAAGSAMQMVAEEGNLAPMAALGADSLAPGRIEVLALNREAVPGVGTSGAQAAAVE